MATVVGTPLDKCQRAPLKLNKELLCFVNFAGTLLVVHQCSLAGEVIFCSQLYDLMEAGIREEKVISGVRN